MKQKFNITHPHLYAQWVNTHDGRDPADYTHGSNEIFSWQCEDYPDHQWESKIKVRSMGSGCPYCANRLVFKGSNDLNSKIPQLSSQWDYQKNSPLKPDDIVFTSTKKYWWICNKGHSIHSDIRGRKSKRSEAYDACPVCSGRKAESGSTDLKSLFPDVAQQCISDIDTSSVTAYSSILLKWVCEKGHQEKEPPKFRVKKRGNHCSQCFKEKLEESKNLKQEKKTRDEETRKKSTLFNVSPTIFSQLNDQVSNKSISYNSAKRVEWMCNKGHVWVCTVYQRVNSNSGCPTCNERHYTSKAEKEIVNYIKSVYKDRIIENDRSIIYPYELDIYIPDKKIAIEYNGLYWHSDQSGKSTTYHYDKWKRCVENGIQLITIWEDDWKYRENVVKKMISHKLNVSNDSKIYARNTDAVIVSKDDARVFCSENHIQGYAPGSVYYGLVDHVTGALIAMSVWKKSGTQLRLERYCTSVNVVGGMGKLLKSGIQYAQENNLNKIVTFSDHDVSDGGLYKLLGFTDEKELRPDYKYVIDGVRVHKFNYRLKRFREDPHLKYEDGLTESQLAQLNNLPRVYDTGKTRWVINVEIDS